MEDWTHFLVCSRGDRNLHVLTNVSHTQKAQCLIFLLTSLCHECQNLESLENSDQEVIVYYSIYNTRIKN